MTYRAILLFVGLVLISACSTPHPDHSKTILKLDLNDSKGDKLSDLFGSISYRLLDTGDDNYLAMPGKLTLSNKLIWVRDSRLSNILVFEEDGQLKTAIKASLNPGPGEFLQSEDFQVFEDRLKIRDYPQNKTFTYNLDGSLREEHRDSDQHYYFHETDRWKLSYLGYSGGPESKLFLLESKSTGDTIFQHAFPNELDFMNYGSKNGFMPDPLDGSLYFSIPHSYETIKFDSDGVVDQVIALDILNSGITAQDRTRWSLDRTLNQKAKEGELVITTDSFFPLKDFFFVHLRQSHPEKANNHFVLYRKSFDNIYQGKNLENDLDGMPLKGVPWSYSDNSIILVINSIQFYYVEQFGGSRVTAAEENIHAFFQKNKARMQEDHYVMVTLNLRHHL